MKKINKVVSDMGFLGVSREIDGEKIVEVKVLETGAFVGTLRGSSEGWKVGGANDFLGEPESNKKILEAIIKTGAEGN